jgi:DedD protein
MAEAQDVDTLKRRGRRRLVGAIALVLLAVIVLPMVFDAEPGKGTPPVSVRIPGEDDTPFTPKVTPKGPPAAPPAAKAEAQKKEPPKQEAPKQEAPKAEPEPAKSEAPKAADSSTQYMVPVGAFANPDSVIAKLAEAKVPYYTESVATVKGKVVRVRAGPFASKEAANRAAEKLKSLGFSPGSVSPRS